MKTVWDLNENSKSVLLPRTRDCEHTRYLRNASVASHSTTDLPTSKYPSGSDAFNSHITADKTVDNAPILSGNGFDDLNGQVDKLVNGTGTGGKLRAHLVNPIKLTTVR